jgi:hypothetical protein
MSEGNLGALTAMMELLNDDKKPVSRRKKIFSLGRWQLTKRDYFY